MKEKVKRNRMAMVIPVLLYIAAVICLFWFHPFVASAKEDDAAAKKVPGGKGNKVHIYSVTTNSYFNTKNVIDRSLAAKDNVEIVGYFRDMTSRMDLCIAFVSDDEGLVYAQDAEGYLSDYVGVEMKYKKNVLDSTVAFGSKRIIEFAVMYYVDDKNNTAECTYTGMKVFKDADSLWDYADTGSLDGMYKEELDMAWYLKDIRLESMRSGNKDSIYIKFYWLTDNLEDGDVIEIKTHNFLKKIGGDQVSGFHDYITYKDGVSALDNLFTDKSGNERASYTLAQYEASKAWFDGLENRPLIFNTYDTDAYYFRPYRNGKFGSWCRVTMGRTADDVPYIDGIQIGDIDDDGNWNEDGDETDKNGGDHGVDPGGDIIQPGIDNPFDGTSIAEIFQYIFDFFKSIPALLGDLPALVNSIIGFLPLPVIGFIGAAIVIAIILCIVGR